MINRQNIPSHWELKKLQEVVQRFDGGSTPSKSNSEYWQGGDIPWATTSDYPDEKYITSVDDSITEEAIENTSSKVFDTNTVFVTIIASIGKTAIPAKPMAVNQQTVAITPDNNIIDIEYLYHFLKFCKPMLEEQGRGGAYHAINQSHLKSLEIPIPPLDEQKRIVDGIEERLDRVKRLERSVQSVRQLSSEYEDSIVAYTFANKDYYNYTDIQTVPDEQDIPEHWEVYRVKDVVSAKNGGTPKRSEPDYWDGDIDWLSSGEVNGKITDSAEECITEVALEETSAKIFPKDSVLVAMYGSGTRGQSTIIRREMSGNQAICCLEPETEIINEEYLLYFYKNIKDNLADKARGGAQSNLNQSMVINEEIPVPPLDEQERIVNKLERIDFDRIEKSSNLLESLFDEYRRSVLAYAFEGKLVGSPSSRLSAEANL